MGNGRPPIYPRKLCPICESPLRKKSSVNHLHLLCNACGYVNCEIHGRSALTVKVGKKVKP